MLLADAAELAETVTIPLIPHRRIPMQISFFSLLHFFQATFIVLTLRPTHSVKHQVFIGEAVKDSVSASNMPGHGSPGHLSGPSSRLGPILPSGIFSCPFAWAKNSVF